MNPGASHALIDPTHLFSMQVNVGTLASKCNELAVLAQGLDQRWEKANDYEQNSHDDNVQACAPL
jgi:hypothetical protein